MVGHDYVSVDSESAGSPSFIKSLTGDRFDCLGAEDFKTVFGYTGEVESGNVPGNRVHCARDQTWKQTERPCLSSLQLAKPTNFGPPIPL